GRGGADRDGRAGEVDVDIAHGGRGAVARLVGYGERVALARPLEGEQEPAGLTADRQAGEGVAGGVADGYRKVVPAVGVGLRARAAAGGDRRRRLVDLDGDALVGFLVGGPVHAPELDGVNALGEGQAGAGLRGLAVHRVVGHLDAGEVVGRGEREGHVGVVPA